MLNAPTSIAQVIYITWHGSETIVALHNGENNKSNLSLDTWFTAPCGKHGSIHNHEILDARDENLFSDVVLEVGFRAQHSDSSVFFFAMHVQGIFLVTLLVCTAQAKFAEPSFFLMKRRPALFRENSLAVVAVFGRSVCPAKKRPLTKTYIQIMRLLTSYWQTRFVQAAVLSLNQR